MKRGDWVLAQHSIPSEDNVSGIYTSEHENPLYIVVERMDGVSCVCLKAGARKIEERLLTDRARKRVIAKKPTTKAFIASWLDGVKWRLIASIEATSYDDAVEKLAIFLKADLEDMRQLVKDGDIHINEISLPQEKAVRVLHMVKVSS